MVMCQYNTWWNNMNNSDVLTFNQWVAGSNPARLTTNIKGLAQKRWAFCFSGFQMGSKNIFWSRIHFHFAVVHSTRWNLGSI